MRVDKQLGSEAAAISFCALHFGQLPMQGDLVLNDDAGTMQVRLAAAVIDSIRPFDYLGAYAGIEYTFRGGLFVGEEIPDPPAIPASDTVKVGDVNLSIGDASKAVVFDTAFASPPRCIAFTLGKPNAGADGFRIDLDESALTAAGFTAVFGANVPAAGYVLRWQATL